MLAVLFCVCVCVPFFIFVDNFFFSQAPSTNICPNCLSSRSACSEHDVTRSALFTLIQAESRRFAVPIHYMADLLPTSNLSEHDNSRVRLGTPRAAHAQVITARSDLHLPFTRDDLRHLARAPKPPQDAIGHSSHKRSSD